MTHKPTYEALAQRVKELEAEALELRYATEMLGESEERFRALFEGSLDAAFVADPESGIILDTNPVASELLMRPYEEIVGLHYTQLHPSRLAAHARERFEEAILDRQVQPVELPVLCSDGSEKSVEIVSQMIQIKGIPVFYGIFRDVTKRKRTEAALWESMVTSRVLLNAVQDVAMLVDTEGYIIQANDAMARRFGRPAPELVGVRSQDLLPSDVAKRRLPHYARLLQSGEVVRYEDERDGICFETLNYPIFNEQGKVIRVAILGRDITARKRAEEILRQSEEMYKTFVRTSPDAVLIIDVHGLVIEVSQQMVETAGYESAEEVLGRSGFEFMAAKDHERARESILRTIHEGYRRNDEFTLLRKGGSTFIGEVSAVAIKDGCGNTKALMLSVRDVTKQKRINEELLKAEKLESLGNLAGGIAHDFNNILTAIVANISMARLYGDIRGEGAKILADAEAAALHAKRLTQQLLTFSKGGAPIKKPTHVSTLLKDTTNFSLSGSNIKCEFFVPDSLWGVDVDEGQIYQVIQNLVINANQAMPEGGGLQVRAENLTLREKDVIPLNRGRYVKFSVTDKGIGIPEKHLAKIFDPFFTTKHEGSGLGLAICYSIVKGHDGYIHVDSKLGVGTTFDVYLPASKKSARPREGGRAKPPMGGGRILLIDDDELILVSAERALKRLGYEVECVRDGAEGISRYRQEIQAGRPFDVVIMDLRIPGGLGGREAVRDLKGIDSGAKVIASSGYSNDPVMSNFKKYGFNGILTKPYRIEELSGMILKVMKGAC